MVNELGAYSAISHTTPDISPDLAKLVQSMEEARIHVCDPKRTYDSRPEGAVTDTFTVGFEAFMSA